MFIGWEGVGLCSYLLIGFWYKETANANAGKKAFIVNRIGDFGFLIGMFLLFQSTGTLNFRRSRRRERAVAALHDHAVPGPSAPRRSPSGRRCSCSSAPPASRRRFPLYVWLPDAMAGPTPVSALIHAATMVTAGVYMVARMHAVYLLSPGALAIVAGDRRADRAVRGDHRLRPERHQEGAGLLDGQPARLHVRRRRHRQLRQAASSTSSRTPSSRPGCSSAPARSCTP